MRDISLYLSTIPDYNQMLAGKNVLITTAARGIGKSIALLFARQGADVYFGGRNEEYVRTTEKELQSIRPGCRGYVVDLAKADQTEAFVDAAVKDSGGFDILVSTVGVNCHCPAAEYKDEDMFRLLETNYLSGVRCARKVIPTMQARGRQHHQHFVHSQPDEPAHQHAVRRYQGRNECRSPRDGTGLRQG